MDLHVPTFLKDAHVYRFWFHRRGYASRVLQIEKFENSPYATLSRFLSLSQSPEEDLAPRHWQVLADWCLDIPRLAGKKPGVTLNLCKESYENHTIKKVKQALSEHYIVLLHQEWQASIDLIRKTLGAEGH